MNADELEAHIASLRAHPELGPLLEPLFALIEAQAARINDCYVPLAKVSRLFMDLFGQPINEATVLAGNERAYQTLAASKQVI